MLPYRKRAKEAATKPPEEVIIESIQEEEVKPPKPVKPLSQKHFKPILEEVGSLKSMFSEIKSNQDKIIAALEGMKKPSEEIKEEIKETKEKIEEVKE